MSRVSPQERHVTEVQNALHALSEALGAAAKEGVIFDYAISTNRETGETQITKFTVWEKVKL